MLKIMQRRIFPLLFTRQVAHAVQQTGFRRQKRYGVPQAVELPLAAAKRADSPWSSLRAVLDEEAAKEAEAAKQAERAYLPDGRIVFDEAHYARLQNSADHRNTKRGYNPLKVENLVDLPPGTDPTDPLFQHQWYLVRPDSKSSLCSRDEMYEHPLLLSVRRKIRVKTGASPSWT